MKIEHALLDEGRAILRGHSRKMITTEHYAALEQYTQLLERTLSIVLIEQGQDWAQRNAYTDALEARLTRACATLTSDKGTS